jgi:WD40 repeat protein
MRNLALFCTFFIVLVLVGCLTSNPAPNLASFSASPTIFIPSSTPIQSTLTPTRLPSLTPSPLPPSLTPTFTQSPTPIQTSSPTITPVPWGEVLLDTENAPSIVQKAVWGLGSLQDSTFSTTNVFVQRTPFGIYLYQADNLQIIRYLPEAGEYVLAPAGDLLFTHLPDGSIQVVELPSGTDKYVFSPIAKLSPWMNDAVYAQLPADRPALEADFFSWVSSIRALAINTDKRLVAIGFGDASVGLWSLESGELVNHLKNVIVNEVSGLVFSPDGEKLLSAGNNGEIAVWNVEDAQLLWRLPKVGHVVGQPFSQDGSLLVLEITQETSSWASLRDARYGDELAPQIVAAVDSQAISPDNKLLVTSWYGTVNLWSIPNLVYQAKIETGLGWAHASFSEDGTYILVNGGEQAYFASDLSRDDSYPLPAQQAPLQPDVNALQLIGHLTNAIGVRYPQPVQAVAWGVLSDHQAWIYDLSQNVQAIYDFGSPFMADPDLSFNGDRLAACTDGGLEIITLLDGHKSNLGNCRDASLVRFSADGRSIFRTSGIVIDVLDPESGNLLYNLRGHSNLVEGLAVTSDGKYLVSIGNFQRTQGREVFWWQVDTPRKIWSGMESVYPSDYLYSAEFDPEGQVLCIVLGGLRCRRLGDLQPHHLDTNRITSLAIFPGGRLLTTGDLDGVIHIWSLEDFQEIITLTGHRQLVTGLAFAPDGTSLLSISTDGTVRLWGLP